MLTIKVKGVRIAFGLMLLLSTAAHAATKIVLSDDSFVKSLKAQSFDVLKQQLEKRLGDKVKVELYQSGTLFNQKTEVQGLQLGSCDIISPTAGIYTPVAPKISVLLLPFLLRTPQAIDAALKDREVRKVFAPELEAKNILPVAIWMNGPRDFGYKGEGEKLLPKDWKGVKIRVQPAPVFVKTMQAIGANVTSISWTEVPAAMEQGVIDAAEPTPNAWKSSGLYKIANHIILNDYVYSFYIVGANRQWWNGLSPDVRKGVEEALEATSKWNWAHAAKINKEDLEIMAKSGTKIHKLTPTQIKAWQKAVAPVWKELGYDAVGAKVMERLKQIAAEYPER